MTDELRAAWDDLKDALAEHAPASFATIRPPVPDAVDRLRAELDVDLTDELLTWFTLHDGTEERDRTGGLGGHLIPEGWWLSVTESIRDARMWERINRHVSPELTRAGLDPGEAGQEMRSMLSQYLSIASDGGGGNSFVDTRRGDRRGCVRYYGGGGVADQPGIGGYPSLTAMLAAVTRSIRTGAEINGWRATMPNGSLWWEVVHDVGPREEPSVEP